MNTKKSYVVPTMEVVKIETASFLAASNDTSLGGGGIIPGRPGIEEPYDN